ncbi:MAG: hypothetical protein KJO43_07010 [Phycisphaerae bacterium]|nr:hypothetical protein [Phycisphaerae bacterium]
MERMMAGTGAIRGGVLAAVMIIGAQPATASTCEVLVAAFGNHKIVAYSADDGSLIGEFVPTGSGGLQQPHHMIFGPDGHLYVASFGNGAVMRYDGASGAPRPGPLGAAGTAQFVTPGLAGLSQTAGLAFGPDGNLYASSLNDSNVRRYDGSTGAFIDEFVTAFSGGLSGAEILVFGADEHLYIGSLNNGAVMRYDGTSGAPAPGPLGAAGSAQFVTPLSGGLTLPHGVTFGPDGALYVCSFGSSQVIRYDGKTGAFESVFTSGPSSAHGLRFGPDGNLYVAGFGFSGLNAYEGETGAALGAFVGAGVGGLVSPADVEFTPGCQLIPCPGDLDGCGSVGFPDLLLILAAWGPCDGCLEDIDMSGDVGFADLLVVLSGWGPCP